MRLAKLIFVAVLVLFLQATGICRSQEESTRKDKVPLTLARVRGGMVNVTEGEVEYVRAATQARPLKPQQELANGDTVRVGAEGRAEILLNPGTYLRLFNNTRVTLLDLSSDNLKIKLWSGSAIIEVAINQPLFSSFMPEGAINELITVITPQAEFGITAGGVYRLNHIGGASDLRVLKGWAAVAGTRVTEGMSLAVSSGKVVVERGGKRVADDFDNWSRNRAVGLIKANHSMNKAAWYKQVRDNHGFVVVEDPEDARRAEEMRTVTVQSGLAAFVEPGTLLKTGGSLWKELKAGDRLTNGDTVRTTTESRAEIHPFPNCYLFLRSDTEIVYLEGSDGQVSVTVLRGSAIVRQGPDLRIKDQNLLPSITLVAAKVDYEISVKGSYRLTVPAGAMPEMIVSEGQVKVAGREIRAPKRILIGSAGPSERPLDKLAVDSLDLWANRRTKPWLPSLRRSFLAGGLWLSNDSTHEYTFVPANWNYRSPYGGEYSIKYAPDNWQQQQRREDFKEPLPPPGPTRP